MIVNDLLEALSCWDGDMQIMIFDGTSGLSINELEWCDSTPGPVLLLIPDSPDTRTIVTVDPHDPIAREHRRRTMVARLNKRVSMLREDGQ